MAFKYPYASPYVFVLNNSIIAIDPDGKRIKVMNKLTQEDVIQSWNTLFVTPNQSSTNAQMTDVFLQVFSPDKGGGGDYSILNLGADENKIKQFKKDYKAALKGLSRDQRKIARGFYKTIMDKGTLDILSYHGETTEKIFENPDHQKKYGNSIGQILDDHGGGITSKYEKDGQIYQVIVVMDGRPKTANSPCATIGNESSGQGTGEMTYAEVFAHEALGHGLSYLQKLSMRINQISAVQISNIARKILGTEGVRNGKDHEGTTKVTQDELKQTPENLKK